MVVKGVSIVKFNQAEFPEHLIVLMSNLYADLEATVQTEHGDMNWLQVGKEYGQAAYSVLIQPTC